MTKETPKHCLYCYLIEYKGMHIPKKEFIQLNPTLEYSSGVGNNYVCKLICAYEMSGYNSDITDDLIKKLEK